MRKPITRKSALITDTYVLELSDLSWGLGYPTSEYNEDDHGVPINYAIEENILRMVLKTYPYHNICCVKNTWNKDATKLIISFEIKENGK